MKEWTIVYTYKRKRYETTTKVCTKEQALQAFAELNTFGSFRLVRIV